MVILNFSEILKFSFQENLVDSKLFHVFHGALSRVMFQDGEVM